MVLIIYQVKIIVSLQGKPACSPWSRADEKGLSFFDEQAVVCVVPLFLITTPAAETYVLQCMSQGHKVARLNAKF